MHIESLKNFLKMEENIKHIVALCDAIKEDIVKSGNKAAWARVRKATLDLEKAGKQFRKESIAAVK